MKLLVTIIHELDHPVFCGLSPQEYFEKIAMPNQVMVDNKVVVLGTIACCISDKRQTEDVKPTAVDLIVAELTGFPRIISRVPFEKAMQLFRNETTITPKSVYNAV